LQRLYALDERDGSVLWRVEVRSIGAIQPASDGSVLLLQASSSAWEDFVSRFKG
jgi:outer membrane protein assembly factor BamB